MNKELDLDGVLDSIDDEALDTAETREKIQEGIVVNEPTEALIAKLRKEYGLTISESAYFRETPNSESNDDTKTNPKTLFGFKTKTLQDTINVHRPYLASMRQAEELRNGKDTSVIMAALPEGQIATPTNEIVGHVNTLVNKILNSHVEISVVPLGIEALKPLESANLDSQGQVDPTNTLPDIAKYEMVQMFIDGVLKRNDIEQVKMRMVDDLVVKGTGVILVEYDRKYRVGQTSKNGTGEIRLKNIDPSRFFPDPNASEMDGSDLDFFYIRNVITQIELMSHENYKDIEAQFEETYKHGTGNLAPDYMGMMNANTIEM
ncbi:hypothetical protein Zmor_016429 [Zophobas morio]|uniref:Uncharacterized protein n=1 Tax=Zophobas morio TaxID=2755281 RepID=A0AA38HP70_9CUCU|nr:hypothetical protein Zmor_016429 [Zophobas morio]